MARRSVRRPAGTHRARGGGPDDAAGGSAGDLEIPVTTTHGEVSRVIARAKDSARIEFWYAEILHGVVPRAWLRAWVTSLAARAPGRFDGVILSTGPVGEVLLSIPPEIIDHPLSQEHLDRLLGGS